MVKEASTDHLLLNYYAFELTYQICREFLVLKKNIP